MLPLWLMKFIIKTGLLHLFSSLPKYCAKSLEDFMNEITENKRLQSALCYSFGDYGKYYTSNCIVVSVISYVLNCAAFF